MTDKESFDVIRLVLMVCSYVDGTYFVVCTDHLAQTYIPSLKEYSEGLTNKWLQLLEIEFEISYKPGVSSKAPDVILRILKKKSGGEPDFINEDIRAVGEQNIASSNGAQGMFLTQHSALTLTKAETSEAHRAYPYCRGVQSLENIDLTWLFREEGSIGRKSTMEGSRSIAVLQKYQAAVLYHADLPKIVAQADVQILNCCLGGSNTGPTCPQTYCTATFDHWNAINGVPSFEII